MYRPRKGAVAGSAHVRKRLYRRIPFLALDAYLQRNDITYRDDNPRWMERSMFITQSDYPAPEPTADANRIQEPDFRQNLTDYR